MGKARIKKSRDNWKDKAIKRSEELRYHRREKKRIANERDKYKKELKEANAKLDKERQTKYTPMKKKEDLVYLSVQLFKVGKVSFRAIPRILSILQIFLGIQKVPCTQTIINWVNHLSIAKIQNFLPKTINDKQDSSKENNSIWIMDMSMAIGKSKILAILSLGANFYKHTKQAPTLSDIDCVAVSVEKSWTGEDISAFLEEVISVTGKPLAYVKDGGKDLEKAVRLLSEKHMDSPEIADVSHIVANLFKSKYENSSSFTEFISSCGKISKQIKNTILGCLYPPKVSTKARFMNLHKLVKWADQILHQSPRGRAKKGSSLEYLRSLIEKLPESRRFIKEFLSEATPLLECQKILKNKGLTIETYDICIKAMEEMPKRSSIYIGFVEWLNCQLKIAHELSLENTGLLVFSDNIESLFGTIKQHGTSQIKDANRMGLLIPAICGTLTKQHVRELLEIRVKDRTQITENMPSLLKQRLQILNQSEDLDSVIQKNESMENLKLIPSSKNRTKNEILVLNQDDYKDCYDLADVA